MFSASDRATRLMMRKEDVSTILLSMVSFCSYDAQKPCRIDSDCFEGFKITYFYLADPQGRLKAEHKCNKW